MTARFMPAVQEQVLRMTEAHKINVAPTHSAKPVPQMTFKLVYYNVPPFYCPSY